MNMLWILGGLLGFLGYVPGLPTELRLLNLLFLVPVAHSVFKRLTTRRQPEQETPAPAVPELPIAPSAGGSLLMVSRLFLSQLLGLFIPTFWPQIYRQLSGQSKLADRVVSSPADYVQKGRYRLPFSGEWYVFNGGVTQKTSHSWDILTQRYAYDFVIVDEHWRRWRTDGRALSDYRCYGVPVCAPADGEIVAITDSVRDAPGPGTGWLDIFTRHFPGNTVTIRHQEGEYSFFAHLIPGSLKVNVGEQVQRGQAVGLCGNSGHSTEPHLHFHFQDGPDFWTAAGLPIAFDDVIVDGQQSPQPIYLVRGTKVQSSE